MVEWTTDKLLKQFFACCQWTEVITELKSTVLIFLAEALGIIQKKETWSYFEGTDNLVIDK